MSENLSPAMSHPLNPVNIANKPIALSRKERPEFISVNATFIFDTSASVRYCMLRLFSRSSGKKDKMCKNNPFLKKGTQHLITAETFFLYEQL